MSNMYLFSLVVAIFVALLAYANGIKYLQTFAGPFYALGVKNYPCPLDVAPRDWYNISLRFLNIPRSHLEPQYLNAHVLLSKPIDEYQKVSVRIDSWSNNQWKENSIAKIAFQHACSSFRSFLPDFFNKMFKLDPHQKPCNVPAANYTLEKEAVNWTFPQMPAFYYGHYRFQALMLKERVPTLCFIVEFKILPKPA